MNKYLQLQAYKTLFDQKKATIHEWATSLYNAHNMTNLNNCINEINLAHNDLKILKNEIEKLENELGYNDECPF